MTEFPHRRNEDITEILALAKLIGDYNMQKGSIDERYLPYVREVAEMIYDAGYRKVIPPSAPITELDLSARAYNCLSRAGLLYISDILAMDRAELMAIRNMSTSIVDEIIHALAAKGYTLKQ